MKKREIIGNFYDGELRRDPKRFSRLGWESREAQFRRFSVLTDFVDLTGKELLDVGCGLGHLLDHLKEKNISCSYTGVDLLDSMHRDASKRHSDHRFLCGDMFAQSLFDLRSFDVIYCSGIFNLNMGNNYDFLKTALIRFLELAREAVVFNLLHRDAPDKEEKYYYFYPDQIIREVEQLTRDLASIRLVEHYLQNDFTLILHL